MSPQQVMDTVTHIQTAGNQIRDRLYQSEYFAEHHMQDWYDDAKTQYQDTKTQWNNAIQEMNRVLNEEAAPALYNMVDNVMMTERQNARGWG
jgi:uncharacterized protein YukE